MIQRNWHKIDLKSAFFPITKEKIQWIDRHGRAHVIPNQYALVDDRGHTLSVVSNQYKVITNEEAYKLSDFVLKGVFSGLSLKDFECFNIYMPGTRGSCRIDLIVPNSYKEPFAEKRDKWVPFVRISNSYNKTLLLKYEVGFCRYICLNGVIYGQKGITVSFNHNETISSKELENEITIKAVKEIGRIDDIWSIFQKKILYLKNTELSPDYWLAIFCKVFGIMIDKNNISDRKVDSLIKQGKSILNASKEYSEELGCNAYALMNVLTDFASFPIGINGSTNYVHTYQHRVGNWINEFISAHRQKDFTWEKYLHDFVESASIIRGWISEDNKRTLQIH